MWAIAKKDIKNLFYSPIGYVVFSISLAFFGIIMYVQTASNRTIDFNIAYNYFAWYGLPIIVAVLTMRSFSEEKSKKTESLLFINQKNVFPIIIGKIIAVLFTIIAIIIISFFYCILFTQFGNINFSRLSVTLLGLLLLSVAYTSFGVLISSLTESQIIAALITIVFLLLPAFFSYGNGVFAYLSLIDFFGKFSSGIISVKSIVTLVSFSITCIILAFLEFDRKRKID